MNLALVLPIITAIIGGLIGWFLKGFLFVRAEKSGWISSELAEIELLNAVIIEYWTMDNEENTARAVTIGMKFQDLMSRRIRTRRWLGKHVCNTQYWPALEKFSEVAQQPPFMSDKHHIREDIAKEAVLSFTDIKNCLLSHRDNVRSINPIDWKWFKS